MSWLAIRWDESGSVFDDLDRILEGLSNGDASAPRRLGTEVEPDEPEDELPSYAWFNHPTLAHAKVWSLIPFLPEGARSPLRGTAGGVNGVLTGGLSVTLPENDVTP